MIEKNLYKFFQGSKTVKKIVRDTNKEAVFHEKFNKTITDLPVLKKNPKCLDK